MKYKILAKLQKKFSGLPKNLLGLVAENMAKKVTEESEIDDAITALDDLPIPIEAFAKHLQKEGDRRYAEGRTKAKQPKDKEDDDIDDDDVDDDDDHQDEPPVKKPSGKGKDHQGGKDKGGNSEFAKLTKLVSTLAESVANMQKKGSQKTIAEQIAARATEKGIPAILLKGRTVEKEEEIDSLMEELETDYESYKQELSNQGWAQTSKPAGGGTSQQSKGDKEKVDPDLVNFVKKQAEAAKPSQAKS
jgi:hypothetical protein